MSGHGTQPAARQAGLRGRQPQGDSEGRGRGGEGAWCGTRAQQGDLEAIRAPEGRNAW